MKRILLAVLGAAALATALAQQQNPSSPGMSPGLRGAVPLTAEGTPPPLPKTVNDDQRKARNFPMQPPLIPHQIDNYQLDKRFNKCMDCHGRSRTQESGAPMVSVTHYLDRNGNQLAEISTRRYFCTGCHVMQTDAKVTVKNTFVDFYNAGDAPKGAGK